MALQYRKVVRDAILQFLTAGFNDAMIANAVIYGITPFRIDFSTSSRNFAIAHIAPENIEKSQLLEYPAGCLYTEAAQDTGIPRGLPFAGSVSACLDFFIRDRNGVEPFDSESFFDAIEDAVLTTLNNPALQWPVGVIFARQSVMHREYLIPLGDGFGTRIPIHLQFEVKRTTL